MIILGAHMSIAGGFAQAAKKTGEEFGSKVDRHDNIGKGLIGKAADGSTNLEGLTEIAKFAEQKSIPLILETPEKDGMTHFDDIKVVREILNAI